MATGVLVIGIERATKILGLVTETSKSYAATVRLGQSTSTEDAEGDITQQVSAQHVTDEAIEAAIAGLRGDIAQIPSAVSAIKVDGQRAYRLVREGQVVELACPAGADRPVRDTGSASPRRTHRRRRRRRLFVGNLHTGPRPRHRRNAGGGRSPDCAAANQGRPVRDRPSSHIGRVGRTAHVEPDSGPGMPGVVSPPATRRRRGRRGSQRPPAEPRPVSTASTPRTPPTAASSPCYATREAGRSPSSSSGRPTCNGAPRGDRPLSCNS